MEKSASEVARIFGAFDGMSGANLSKEIYPGYPGTVLAEGHLRSMVWGFPLVLKSKRTGQPLKPKPVNNCRTDKLSSYMWRYSFEERRCLIPLTAWAEAEGPRGAMTRTWLSLHNADVFAVAGIWQDTPEWGLCYSMVMTEAVGDAAEVHSRMPVVLAPDRYDCWQNADPATALELCRPYEGALAIARTEEPWNKH